MKNKKELRDDWLLEDTVILCPFCNSEINAKVLRVGRKDNYVVSEQCFNCGKSASNIESAIKQKLQKQYQNREKLYQTGSKGVVCINSRYQKHKVDLYWLL